MFFLPNSIKFIMDRPLEKMHVKELKEILLRYLHRQILHIFATFLVVILWILSICHYIDSIPQLLRN